MESSILPGSWRVGLASVVQVEVLRAAADVEVVGVRGVYSHAADELTAGSLEDRHPGAGSGVA